MRNTTLLIFLLILANTIVSAQQPYLYFEKLTIQNGLSHNKINCIIQDKRGFIWFGTDDGLNRYDGHNFEVFRHEPGNGSSISGNIITDIVEDSDGVLWIATADGGLTRYNHRLAPKLQFKQYRHLPGDSTSIPVNIINTMMMDPQGYLWLGTSGHSVLRFDRKTEKFVEPIQRGTRTVLDIILGDDGLLWVGRAGGSILKINPVDLSYQMDERYINNLYGNLPHTSVSALFNDEEKNIWFGSWDRVLYRVCEGKPEEVFQQTKSPWSFKNDEIDCFASDKQGRIWMGGRYSGLHIYDKKTGNFYNYSHDPSKEGTITGNTILCLFNDKNGILWIGTTSGVSVCHPIQQQFVQNFLPRDNSTDITVYDFFQQENDDLWIGTSEGIFIKKPDQSIIQKKLEYEGTKLSVTRFFKDVDGSFYIGTDYSLFLYDVNSHKFSVLPNTDKDRVISKIIDSRVVSIIRDTIDNNPVLMVSPYGHFLVYYDLVEKKWVSRIDTVKKIIEKFNLQDNLIRKMYRTSDGRIWFANAKLGLGEWVKHSPPRLSYSWNNPISTKTITNNNVYDLAEDAKGNLWITTYGGGLQYFNRTSKTFTHIPATNNLLEGLQIDRAGHIWMLSNGNIHKYDPDRKSYTSFDLPDIEKSGGVKGNIYKDNRGHMYMGGTNFFIEFDPSAVREDRQVPEIHFTDFRIFTQSRSDLLLEKNIVLKYTQNYFTVQFAAPDYSPGTNVQYAYILEGRDKQWNDLGTRNFEQFSNLEGGNYTLKVRATNSAGLWSDKIGIIKIVIIPPFWKSWWFYLLCAVLTALIIYAIYRYRINELLKRQAIRNKIAQDLHDNVGSTLSSISVYSQVAKIYNNQEKSTDLQQTLEKISATSSEMISEMNDIVWAINPRNDSMSTILQRMESFARPLLASQNIAVHFEADPNLSQLNLDMTKRKNFYLIFKEAIHNALKYSNCTSLSVKIGVQHHHLELNVTDNGRGFDLEKVQIHASQSLSGNGLRNMEMRAAEMKGQLQFISKPGEGTQIQLNFPVP